MAYTKTNWVNGATSINASRLNNMENGIGYAHDILDARGDSFGKNVGTGANDVAAGNHLHDTRYYTKSEIDAKFANTGTADHNHDTRYYKKSETDSLLAGKANSSHNHDSRYYTESEVNNLLSGKSNTGHTHDSRYYTESEVDNLLEGKSNTGHTHDSRYYKQSEVDAFIRNLQLQINAIKHNIGMD